MTAPKVSAKVELDISQFENAVNQVLARAAAADKALGDIGGSIDIKLNIDDSSLNALKGQVADFSTVDLKLNVEDSEIRTAMSAVEDKSAKVKIDAQDNTDSTLKSIEGKLTRLQQFATIELILDAAAFVSTFESLPIISTLADIDKQTDLVVGRTGRDLPEAGAIIRDVYNNAWGESREEVAGVVSQLAMVKDANDEFAISAENLEAAVLSAYDTAAVGGEDINEVIRAAQNLVGTGLVDSYGEAFDFIAKGFQSNLNQGDDFLDTITEYSQQFRDAGLSAEGFFNLMNTAVVTGNFNTDKAADAFKEFFNLVHEEVADFERTGTLTPRVEQLQALGLIDETDAFAAGELSGDAYAQAVLDKIATIPDEAQRLLAAKQIFGPTQVEEIGEAFFENLDLGKDIDWQGAASEGSTIINDNLSTSLTEAARTFEDALVTALDNALNISGFLDKVTGAATTFADSIQAGMSIGQALEISLALPEGSFSSFESSVGNFAIGVLELIAGVQEFLGRDSSGTRAAIARQAETQLAFDLQLDDMNTAELSSIIELALDRGVEGSRVQEIIQTAADEMIASGNVQELQALINQIEHPELSPAALAFIDEAGGIYEAIDKAQTALGSGAAAALTDEALSTLKEVAGLESLDLVNQDALQAQVDEATKAIFDEYRSAIEASDFSLATELGKKLGRSGTDVAADAAAPGITSFFDAFRDSLTTASGEFIGEVGGGLVTANDLVDLPTMTTEFMTAGEQIQVANDGMINSARDLQGQVSDSVSVIVGDTEVLATDGRTNLDTFTSGIQAMSGALVDTVVNLSEPLANFAALLGDFVGFGTAAVTIGSSINNQGGVPNPAAAGGEGFGFAGGGVSPSGSPFWTGEQGPEIMSMNEQAAVLNTQTSQAVISGLQALFGGMMPGGGTYNNQRVANQYITVNTQSPAQDANAVYTMNNTLRGFS